MIYGFKHKTMFDLVKEAEEDETSSDTAESQVDQAQDQAPSPEESNDEGGEDDFGADDEFDIDTSLDDESGDSDTGSTDDSDTSTDTSSTDNEEAEDTSEEAVSSNTDIFSSLSAEEQKIKIMELKNLFANLYTSTSDLLDKINSSPTDDSNIEVIERISMSLYSLRIYIKDYITNKFSQKTYIENDISFNRFLAVLNSISVIIKELNTEKQEKLN